MNRYEKSWIVLLAVLIAALAGCHGSQADTTSYEPSEGADHQDWASFTEAQNRMWDRMHQQDQENVESWRRTLNHFGNDAGRSVGSMGHQVDSYLRSQQRDSSWGW
jgi:hypothetical protein